MKTSHKPKRKGAPRNRRLVSAQDISDFRIGIDVVVREDGKTFVRDTQGKYADVEVLGDELTDERKANFDSVFDGSEAHVRGLMIAIRNTPFMSEEGRGERLQYFRSKGYDV